MSFLITRGLGRNTRSGQSGEIILNNNGYMNIAIPVEGVKVKEYFVDKVLEKH